MTLVFAGFVLLLSLLGWAGQVVSLVLPTLAVRLGLTEAEADVDPVFYADVRAECFWDALSLWPLPVAAVLLILGEPCWAVFGLIGGGMFLYFAGRGIAQRHTMRRRDISVGKESNVKTAYVFLFLWGAIALATIVLACRDLNGGW